MSATGKHDQESAVNAQSHIYWRTAHSRGSGDRATAGGEHRMVMRKDRTSVIDVIAEDAKTGEAVLVMNEPNEWDGSDEQLLALQERFNAYLSFLLDGEIAEAHPELAGKPARIELRCVHMPDARALELLGLIHDQLAFQDIKLEVVVTNDPPSSHSTGTTA